MRKMIIAATVTAAAATLAVASIATATSTTKTETFTAMTTNPGSGVASLIATGGFTAGGTMTTGKHKLTFRFAGGKFTLVIGRPGSKHVSLNPTHLPVHQDRLRHLHAHRRNRRVSGDQRLGQDQLHPARRVRARQGQVPVKRPARGERKHPDRDPVHPDRERTSLTPITARQRTTYQRQPRIRARLLPTTSPRQAIRSKRKPTASQQRWRSETHASVSTAPALRTAAVRKRVLAAHGQVLSCSPIAGPTALPVWANCSSDDACSGRSYR